MAQRAVVQTIGFFEQVRSDLTYQTDEPATPEYKGHMVIALASQATNLEIYLRDFSDKGS